MADPKTKSGPESQRAEANREQRQEHEAEQRDLNTDTGPRPGETNPRTGTGEGQRLGSRDTLAAAPEYLVPTTEDALGTERIVAPTYDSWTPAPTDPTDEEVKRAEQVEEGLKQAKARRHKLLTGDNGDSERERSGNR